MQNCMPDDSSTHPCEAHFIAEMMEATNAVLSVLVVVILHKAESESTSAMHRRR
jgi:hypothetical protein